MKEARPSDCNHTPAGRNSSPGVDPLCAMRSDAVGQRRSPESRDRERTRQTGETRRTPARPTARTHARSDAGEADREGGPATRSPDSIRLYTDLSAGCNSNATTTAPPPIGPVRIRRPTSPPTDPLTEYVVQGGRGLVWWHGWEDNYGNCGPTSLARHACCHWGGSRTSGGNFAR